MHYLFGFLYGLLKCGPITLGGLAVAILGAGFYLQIGENERNVARMAAIAAGPPPVFNVEKFDRDHHMTDQREVVVRAQPVFDLAYRLTYSQNSDDDYAYMVPLVAPDADNTKVVSGIALYTSNIFIFDDLTPELLGTGITGFGGFGPVLDINGRVSSLGKWQDMTDEAFEEQGLTLADNAVVFRPYLEGREAALAPSDVSVFQFFSYIAGVFGLLALFKLVIRKTPKDTPAAPQAAAFDAPMHDPVAVTARQASAVPLWKQRAGLVDEADMAANAVPKSATFEMTRMDLIQTSPRQSSMVAPTRSGLGVRKVLIGIVGVLFMLGLSTTVIDLISKSPSAKVVAVPTVQETVADGLADIIVPDADPNRHWTDVDIGPMVEWVVAKGLLAISGDTDAMILLGSMIGALLFLMFMLRYFWVVRFALKSKSHSSFNDLYSR